MRSSLTELFAALILLNFADATLTSLLVFEYGPSVEANPILQDFIVVYGVASLYGFKYFLISLLGILLLALKSERHIMVASGSLVFVNIVYGFVVLYSVVLYFFTINI